MLAALLLLAALSPADRATIEAGEKAWGNAFVKGDAATVDAILSDDFVGTGPDGKLYDRSTMLGWLRAGPRLASNDTTIVRVRSFGDIVIVNGRDAIVTAAHVPHVNAWTDIWARRDGNWRIVSAQDTRVGK